MKVIFERRNAEKRNPLRMFERFDSILTSLTESSRVEVEVRGGEVVLRNSKYFLIMPSDKEITEAVLKSVVLRRFNLRILDRILLYGLVQTGDVRFGRSDEEVPSPSDTMDDYPSCRFIEIAS